MVNFNVVKAWSGMVAEPKALVMVGAATPTVRFADAVLPVPPFVEVTLPVVFVYWPEATPVTVTLNWHWLLAAIVAPLSAIPVGVVVVRVPPQTVAEAFATASPAGKLSVKATPVSATALAAGLAMVKVNEVVEFSVIDAGLKAFAITGGATTLMLAEAVPPVPPSFEVTLPVTLFLSPALVPVTFTENVHEVFAANVAPARLITLPPAVAVMVPPPQLPVRPLGFDTTSPVGNASLNATPVKAVVVFGFWMVKLKEVKPFSGMLAAPNALLITGAAATLMLAVAVLLVPASLVAVTLLFLVPVVVPWTLRDTVQDPPAGILPPARLADDAPAVAVAVPPQVLLRLGVGATTRPAGKLSVNARPVAAAPVFGFWMVKVREVTPFSGICAAPNAF